MRKPCEVYEACNGRLSPTTGNGIGALSSAAPMRDSHEAGSLLITVVVQLLVRMSAMSDPFTNELV